MPLKQMKQFSFSGNDAAAAAFDKIPSLSAADADGIGLISLALVLIKSQMCQQDDGLKVDPGHSWRCVAISRSQRILLNPPDETAAE